MRITSCFVFYFIVWLPKGSPQYQRIPYDYLVHVMRKTLLNWSRKEPLKSSGHEFTNTNSLNYNSFPLSVYSPKPFQSSSFGIVRIFRCLSRQSSFHRASWWYWSLGYQQASTSQRSGHHWGIKQNVEEGMFKSYHIVNYAWLLLTKSRDYTIWEQMLDCGQISVCLASSLVTE